MADFAGIAHQQERKRDDDWQEDEDDTDLDGDIDEECGESQGADGPAPNPMDHLSLEHWDRRDPHDNLFLLMLDFSRHARDNEGLAAPTFVLACDYLRRYLCERHSDGRSRSRRRSARSRKRPQASAGQNVLLPDDASLDHWGGKMLDFPFPQTSQFTAVMLILPAWLRFLSARGLAHDPESALASLQPLAERATEVLTKLNVAPAVVADLRRRWELPEL